MFNVLFRKHTSQIVKTIAMFLLVLSTTTGGSTAGFTGIAVYRRLNRRFGLPAVLPSYFTAFFSRNAGLTAGKPNRRFHPGVWGRVAFASVMPAMINSISAFNKFV